MCVSPQVLILYLMYNIFWNVLLQLHMTYANKETLTVSQREMISVRDKPITARLHSACDVPYSVYCARCFYDVIDVTSGI